MADHQIALVYVKYRDDIEPEKKLLTTVPGVETVLDEEGKKQYNLNHPRYGNLVIVVEPESWFTCYYWLGDNKAPDFAPSVDIHNKPGYDPAELFIDPGISFPKLRIARRLLQKKLGFRYVLDVIPLEGSLIKGSHGRLSASDTTGPLLASNTPGVMGRSRTTKAASYRCIQGDLGPSDKKIKGYHIKDEVSLRIAVSYQGRKKFRSNFKKTFRLGWNKL